MKLTELQRTVLMAAADDNLTWRTVRSGRSHSFRLWSSEHDYRTVTPQGEWLLRHGLIRLERGWRYGRGGVEITQRGRSVLRGIWVPCT